MGEAVEMIDKERSERVTPIFVSVDPARDPVPQVAKYIKGECLISLHSRGEGKGA